MNEKNEVTLAMIHNQFSAIYNAVEQGKAQDKILDMASGGITLVNFFRDEMSKQIVEIMETIQELPKAITEALER